MVRLRAHWLDQFGQILFRISVWGGVERGMKACRDGSGPFESPMAQAGGPGVGFKKGKMNKSEKTWEWSFRELNSSTRLTRGGVQREKMNESKTTWEWSV